VPMVEGSSFIVQREGTALNTRATTEPKQMERLNNHENKVTT